LLRSEAAISTERAVNYMLKRAAANAGINPKLRKRRNSQAFA